MPEIIRRSSGRLAPTRAHRSTVKVVAITGGKGGVGKTLTRRQSRRRARAARPQHDAARRRLRARERRRAARHEGALESRARRDRRVRARGRDPDGVVAACASCPRPRAASSMATLEPRAARGAHRRVQPAARAARRAARRHRGRRRATASSRSAKRRSASSCVVCDEPASLTDAYGLIKVLAPAAAELPVRDRREHGRHAGARARALREAPARLPSLPRASRRPTSATCRTTTTCARRSAARRRSSKRSRAARRRARSSASPAPSTAGKRRRRRAAASSSSWSGCVRPDGSAPRRRAMTPGYKTAVAAGLAAGRRARAASTASS